MTAVRTTPAPSGDGALIRALRGGEEKAFATLLERHQSSLLRFACTLVASRALAEEIVRETWLGVIRGLEGFRGECSLRTWIHRILLDVAGARAAAETRPEALSAVADDEPEAAVDPGRFLEDGHWSSFPLDWRSLPRERLLSVDTLGCVQAAIDGLPALHRQVITLRDVSGWSSSDVSDLLGVSDADQRLVLHRARARVRAALDDHLAA